MRHRRIILYLTFICNTAIAQTGDEIIGCWLTTEKDAIFCIFKLNNVYYGKLDWTPADGIDYHNPDPALRKTSIIGRTTIKNLVFNGKDAWTGGSIYNGSNGKTYSCRLKLIDHDHLDLHGYIGIPLLGRSVIWTRVKR